MEIVSSGIVAVPSGVSSTGLYFIQEGILQVLNDGWAQDIGLAEGGRAVVSSGGILYVCTVSSGGTAAVLKGGCAQDITVKPAVCIWFPAAAPRIGASFSPAARRSCMRT